MSYTIVIQKPVSARQGLKSPVRAWQGLSALPQGNSFETMLRVGISFKDAQLKDTGWFVDTDAVETIVAHYAQYLSSDSWTKLFDFRPTYELVTRQAYKTLSADIEQLSYVELDNLTLGVTTRYQR